MQFYGKVVRCDNPDCALPVFRQMAGRTLTDAEMNELLAKGSKMCIRDREKPNLIADDQVNWEELRKCGIDKEKLSEKDLKALMNYRCV